MEENLVIVESPAKAKTIKSFLGKDFTVKSSYGHIRDLAKKEFSIDIKNNYQPKYIVPDDKKNVVKELKDSTKKAKLVWLASDEDREGEAIAWHLSEVLELDPSKTKRIVFHEITKSAIQNAIKTPREIDHKLVDAQQARRILDRIVGFELSPVLWRKVKPSLSAGRVQSVAVRLLVEREREILHFESKSSYRIIARFIINANSKQYELEAELNKRLPNKKAALEFLKNCINAGFSVEDVVKKPAKKSPSAPFTTSTLQQEASRKLGFSVARTMSIAQKLYEAGKITYMRTDSVNLSKTVLSDAKTIITKDYGEKYLNTRQFKTKSKGAQEAHEAIRPTYLKNKNIDGNDAEKKLYDLIWKRTVASQMKDAELEKTTVTIEISGNSEKFIATGQVLKFDGFLKVYKESTEDGEVDTGDKLLPPIKKGDTLERKEILSTQKFTHHPPRYTEASLVRKLEEMGIGRPSTYAPTISTIQGRGYVVKEDRPGTERKYNCLTLDDGNIKEEVKTETTGAEKNKLFPKNIGMVVTDFLVKYFKEIMDFNFTAKVEEEFDYIAAGKEDWYKMIDRFYKTFHHKVEDTLEKSEKNTGARVLGKDPKTGKDVVAKIGKYGPIIQIGDVNDEEKPKFASLRGNQYIETITLEEALKLFNLPRNLGQYEGEDVIVSIGRFGPYVRHNSLFASLKKNVDDPYTIELDRAIELIEEKKERERNRIIKTYKSEPDLQILRGRWGPYIAYKKKNYRIPKKIEKNPEDLTIKDCKAIIKEKDEKDAKKKKN
jgi:DNA topoisomerase-1